MNVVTRNCVIYTPWAKFPVSGPYAARGHTVPPRACGHPGLFYSPTFSLTHHAVLYQIRSVLRFGPKLPSYEKQASAGNLHPRPGVRVKRLTKP